MNPFETPPSQPSQEKPQDKETVLSPEELIQAKECGLTPEEFLLAQAYQAEIDHEAAMPKLSEKEMQEVVQELELALTHCEKTHPLQELYAITNLTPEDAPKHTAREALKEDLIEVVRGLNVLENRTSISSTKLQELKSRYQYLSQAVGMINNGTIDHTRG